MYKTGKRPRNKVDLDVRVRKKNRSEEGPKIDHVEAWKTGASGREVAPQMIGRGEQLSEAAGRQDGRYEGSFRS